MIIFKDLIKAYSRSSSKCTILPSEFVYKYEETKKYYFHCLFTFTSINGNRSKMDLLQNEASMRHTDRPKITGYRHAKELQKSNGEK